jgi:uncharacterized membrane protein YgcG
MTKKIIALLITIIVGISGIPGIANAQDFDQTLPQETIVSFGSNIVVNTDNSINVTEDIVYNTGPQEHHGIYRDIYPYSSQNRKMTINNVSVSDENGNPYIFDVSDNNGNVEIKIGDPNQTFIGQKDYIIKYHATMAVAQLKNVDEIYWNVTGNEWGMPISSAQATVILPSGAKETQSACYYGIKGSTNQCQSPISNKDGTYSFSAPYELNPSEGLTIAVGFSKGIVRPYSLTDNVSNFFNMYGHWIISAMLPILTLIGSLLYWFKKGRDAKGRGTIVPQYDVQDGLTPMEVGGIANEKVDGDNISAEIIYLATKGYLKIHQLDKRFIGLIKSADYELIKLKDFSDLPNDFDRNLLTALFGNSEQLEQIGMTSSLHNVSMAATQPSGTQNESVQLSSLRFVFFERANLIIKSVLDALLNKGYYKNLGRIKKGGGSRTFIFIFMSVWATGFFGAIIGFLLWGGDVLPIMLAILISIVIYGVISHFSPAKTEKGALAKEYLLGLKDYLQIAEKDRLQFHDAPEKKPEVFEKLLPYAMVLGVTKIWAKEFEDIYTVAPSWYSGPMDTAFSAMAFSDSLSGFSSFASSSMTSSTSSGGSGGGGSSGGGGGGGGGGSW